jgi:hypothetical protein
MLTFTMFNVYLPKLLDTRRRLRSRGPSGTSSFLPSEGVQELWCVSFIPSEFDLFIDDEHFLAIGHYTSVGRMVDREAGPRNKIVPGWTYAFDRDALRRFCVFAQNPIAVGISFSSSVRGPSPYWAVGQNLAG